jgi:predicted RNase H-like nuclease (RuvC/YqgF family)
MVKVSGVPYEVDLENYEQIIAELDRENRQMRARMERLEQEIEMLKETKDDLK